MSRLSEYKKLRNEVATLLHVAIASPYKVTKKFGVNEEVYSLYGHASAFVADTKAKFIRDHFPYFARIGAATKQGVEIWVRRQ